MNQIISIKPTIVAIMTPVTILAVALVLLSLLNTQTPILYKGIAISVVLILITCIIAIKEYGH